MTSLKFIIASGFFLLSHSNIKAQCNELFEYATSKSTDNQYVISVKCNVSTNATVQLYDLNTGKIVKEKKVILTTSLQTLFTNVLPSTYSLLLKTEGCNKTKSLGGITGIDLK